MMMVYFLDATNTNAAIFGSVVYNFVGKKVPKDCYSVFILDKHNLCHSVKLLKETYKAS